MLAVEVEVAHPVEPLPHLDRRGHEEGLDPLEVRGEGVVRAVGYARSEDVDGRDVELALGGLQVERDRLEAGEDGEESLVMPFLGVSMD